LKKRGFSKKVEHGSTFWRKVVSGFFTIKNGVLGFWGFGFFLEVCSAKTTFLKKTPKNEKNPGFFRSMFWALLQLQCIIDLVASFVTSEMIKGLVPGEISYSF
jgi:hypothetical protein